MTFERTMQIASRRKGGFFIAVGASEVIGPIGHIGLIRLIF
jgi:hypothetical protein